MNMKTKKIELTQEQFTALRHLLTDVSESLQQERSLDVDSFYRFSIDVELSPHDPELLLSLMSKF